MNKERLQAMGEMAATLAHEIRNPLGSIQIYCSMLVDELQPGASKDLAEKVYRGIRHLENVIESSLEFTRCGSLNRSEVSACELLKESIELLNPGDVKLEVSSEPAAGLLDKAKLKQAILNVLKNAVEAASESEEQLVLASVGPASGNASIVITIEDSGAGISEEQVKHIFDPFVSAKESGTGLGLSVTAAIVDSHGGRIEVSKSGLGGAKFEITL